MKGFAVCGLLALLALPAAALEPYLVKDVEPVATPVGSHPAQLVTFRGAVLFFAGDGVSGRQLWRSDGTAAGTFPLSEAPLDAFPQPMAFFVTERLYFFLSAHPVTGVPSLWVSDGTPAGTFRLTEEGVAVAGLQRLFAASQGLLYFTARDPEHGAELWRSDGTPAGTHIVDDVRPGPEGADVRGLAELRGLVWFGANDGMHGGALWRTDGTPAGTALALDPIPSSSGHGALEHLQTLRNRLVFFAPPPGRGRSRQLWAGDGTVKGTFPITSFPQGTVLLEATVAHADRLYFVVQRKSVQQLWVSDGTAGGTRMLTSAPSSRLSPDLSVSKGLGNRLIFRAFDPEHGLEPWVTDGTPAGTRLLRDACPGACSGFPFPQRVFAGRLYFTAATSFSSNGLWSTDGTPAGTRLVKDGIGTAYAFFEAGGRLLFVNADHENGAEIWRTDGTAAGTVRVTDFAPPFLWEEEDFSGAVLGGQLFFNADDGEHGYELWRTDGTAGTPPHTELVEDLDRTDAGGSFPRSFLRLGNELLFFTGAPGPPELWKSDGTAAGTVRVRTFGPEELDGTNPRPGLSAEAGGVLVYLSPELGGNHIVVWRTDGTEAGTFRLTEGSGVASSGHIEGVGSTVFFTLRDEELGTELWATDGTVAGTRRVEDVIPGLADAQPHDLTAFQGKLYYSGIGPGDGFELWSSDGTAAGTEPVADLVPGPVGSNPIFLTVHAGRLWFFTDGGEQLWSSDGTAAGTRLEVDFRPEPGLFLATFMATLGDRLVISVAARGLWVTDGTPAGTRQVSSREIDVYGFPWAVFQGRLFYIANGMLSATDGTEAGTGPYQGRDGHEIFGIGAIAVLGDRLIFTAQGSLGAVVVWESDGTQAGTRPLEPEVRVSDPTALLRAGDRVFFPGFEPLTGWELWAVRP